MKILFFSDVHGSPEAMELLLVRRREFAPDLCVLLGDALYHGPRNPLLPDYEPRKVVEQLNSLRDTVAAVRGNCDAEVDQLLLDFPIMADYSTLFADGARFFLTHGHLWSPETPPPLTPGTVFASGHTHRPRLERLANRLVAFNPGSISLPKGGSEAAFGTFDSGVLRLCRLADGEPTAELAL